jgi:hypothetical protein
MNGFDKEGFDRRLKQSLPSVGVVAAYFIRKGYGVHVSPQPNPTSDDGDLFVRKPATDDWQQIEVKQFPSLEFRKANGDWDWYEHTLVEKCAIADTKKHKDRWYFILDANMEEALFCDWAKWHDKMHTETMPDKDNGGQAMCWMLPTTDLHLINLGD